MLYLHTCNAHAKAMNKLCIAKDCSQLLCEDCLPQHPCLSRQHSVVLLNPQSLNFFEVFTGYTHYKMFDWVDSVRRHGFYSLFEVNGGGCEAGEEELTAWGIHVLEQHQRLCQNNRQFVLNNKASQHLYHPQFLRDIINLATEKWEVSASTIISSLSRLVYQKYGKTNLFFRIQQQFIDCIQSYRAQLLTKIEKQVICSVKEAQPEGIMDSMPSDQHQPVGYELPYSIRQIESFEEIEERIQRARKTMCSIANDHDHQALPSEGMEIARLRNELETARQENSALLEENRLLKASNHELSREKEVLLCKVEAFAKENKENDQQGLVLSSKAWINGCKVRVVK